MRLALILTFLCIKAALYAQSATITGHISDAETGEALIGAVIYERQLARGATCNQYGFYSLTIPNDSISVSFSYVGYEVQQFDFLLQRDTLLNVTLHARNVLDSVVIYGGAIDPLSANRISTIDIPIKMITDLPALMGEPDVLKSLQLLPGVKMGYEGSSGIYVRGGGPDQNLVILDGVPIYNANHVYGFFSAFNPDAINHVELITGGFPARYGGRLSSIVDITMKEGNLYKLKGQVTLGVITSRFVLEGPIVKEKGSFIISARRSYLNLLRAPIIKSLTSGGGQDFYFYDLNAKLNYHVNAKNRLFLSGYLGQDHSSILDEQHYQDSTRRFESSAKSQQSWGNLIVASRWNHTYSGKLFSNVTAMYTKYNFEINNETIQVTKPVGQDESTQFYKYIYQSGVRDLTARVDFDYIPNPANYFRFGTSYTNHLFTPGAAAIHSSESVSGAVAPSTDVYANEVSTYAEDEVRIGGPLKVNAGIHAAIFLTDGANYPSAQPRISASYQASKKWSLRAGYASMRQYVHLLSNAGLGLPTDLWVPTTSRVGPESSYQETIGVSKAIGRQFQLSVEGYYKTMKGLIEYKEGANYLSTFQSWEDKVEIGHGESYGSEVLFQKKAGSLTGWIGYTLSWTMRQFDNINNGLWFPYRYDRRHDVKVVMAYKLNQSFDFGATWIFATGNAVSVPLDIYEGAVQTPASIPMVRHYESRNGFRMSNYHRLDVGVTFTKQVKSFEHSINLSIYNAYYRHNPFYLDFGFVDNKYVLKQVSLFPILPSLSYTLKF